MTGINMINRVNIQHETLNGAAFVIRRRVRFVPFSRRGNCSGRRKKIMKNPTPSQTQLFALSPTRFHPQFLTVAGSITVSFAAVHRGTRTPIEPREFNNNNNIRLGPGNNMPPPGGR